MTTTAATVLWTSGWDSTFRVLQLVLIERRTVQPWYVRDERRRSTQVELDTQERIRAAIRERDPAAADRLLPTIVHKLSDVPANAAITAKWRMLAERSHIGKQNDWLARLAHDRDATLELNIHRDDKAHAILDGSVRPERDGVMILDERIADPALSLFSRFRFPLFDMSKLDMQEQAEREGFADIMEMTWFCHSPLIGRRPCGYCNPCRYTREEGLGRRVPDPSLPRWVEFRLLNAYSKAKTLLLR